LQITGLCLLQGSQIKETHHIPTSAHHSLPQRLHGIAEALEAFIVKHSPQHIAVEDQFLGSFYVAQAQGISERKNLKTIQGLSYVKGLVLTFAGKYKIPVIQVNVSQWRTRYLPRRQMSKQEILTFINQMFSQTLQNHNISDAVLIGLCGQAMLQEQTLYAHRKQYPPSPLPSPSSQSSQSSQSSPNTLTKRPRL
jgi:Holliday junction resolvasome RuvABC endonuclease subunit